MSEPEPLLNADEYANRIERAVASLRSERYTPKLQIEQNLTTDNLRIIADLLSSSVSSQFLPSAFHNRVQGVEQPSLTHWINAMETHYRKLRDVRLSGQRQISDVNIGTLVAGMMIAKLSDSNLEVMTVEQELHYMLLVQAIEWSKMDHLVYSSYGEFGQDTYVLEDDVTAFLLAHPDRKDIDRACEIIMNDNVLRFSEVVSVIDGEVPRSLVIGTL